MPNQAIEATVDTAPYGNRWADRHTVSHGFVRQGEYAWSRPEDDADPLQRM